MKYTLLGIKKFLAEKYKTEISGLEPIGQGEWSKAYYFAVNNQSKVIRISRLDEDFKRDKFAWELASGQIPIPEIEEIGKIEDDFYAISSRIDGIMIDNLDSHSTRSILPELLRLLISLQQVETSQTKGFGGWDVAGNGVRGSWNDFVTSIAADTAFSRLKGWKEKLTGNKRALEIFNQGYKELKVLSKYCPEKREVIHNDLLHFNVLAKDNKITGVIDWGCALYGDHLYDLAMFTLWQFYYPAMKGIDLVNEAKQYFKDYKIDLTNFEERLRCYQIHLALDGMAYNAYKENWKDMELTSSRLLEVIK